MNRGKKRILFLTSFIIIIAFLCFCYGLKAEGNDYEEEIYHIAEEHGYDCKKNIVLSNHKVWKYTLTEKESGLSFTVEVSDSHFGNDNDEIFIDIANKIDSFDDCYVNLYGHMKIVSSLTELAYKGLTEEVLIDFLEKEHDGNITGAEEYILNQKNLDGNGYSLDYYILKEDLGKKAVLIECLTISV